MYVGQLLFFEIIEAAGIPAGHGSVVAVARLIGVGRMTVDRWRRGDQQPTPEHLVMVRNALKVDVTILLDSEGFHVGLNPW